MRRNHNNSRRAFYHKLIEDMGDDCSVEFSKLKNLAFGSLTKKNVRKLDVIAVMPVINLMGGYVVFLISHLITHENVNFTS